MYRITIRSKDAEGADSPLHYEVDLKSRKASIEVRDQLRKQGLAVVVASIRPVD